jgi:hypothetical protein
MVFGFNVMNRNDQKFSSKEIVLPKRRAKASRTGN